jgi:xylan 1,4-beta-xylosidase
MIWNYHDDDIPRPSSKLMLTVNNVAGTKVLVHHYRVDQQFSNSFEKWKTMQKPQQVTADQYQKLEQAGQLQLYTSPEWKKTNKGELGLRFDLPGQSVSFIQISW